MLYLYIILYLKYLDNDIFADVRPQTTPNVEVKKNAAGHLSPLTDSIILILNLSEIYYKTHSYLSSDINKDLIISFRTLILLKDFQGLVI